MLAGRTTAPVDYHKMPVFMFAAAGWLKVFYYGVGKCFQKQLDVSRFRFGGASAGALVAAGLVLGVDFDSVAEYTFRVTNDCRSSLLGPLRLRDYLYECLDQHIAPDGHVRASNRLFVAVTELPSMRPHLISQFRTRAELIFYLMASCLIPVLAGLPLPWAPDRGPSSLADPPPPFTFRWLIDGGFRQMLPLVAGVDNYTCSAIGPAHLTPYRRLPARYCLYPPEESEFRRIYRQGFDDAAKWLLSVSIPSIDGDRPLLTLNHSRSHPHEIDNPLHFSVPMTNSTSTSTLPSSLPSLSPAPPAPPSSPNRATALLRMTLKYGSQTNVRARPRTSAKYVPDCSRPRDAEQLIRPQKSRLFYLQQAALTAADLLLLLFSAVFLAPLVWYAHLLESAATFCKRVLSVLLLGLLRFVGLDAAPKFSLSESWRHFRNSLQLGHWLSLLRFLPISSYVIARRSGRHELSSSSSIYQLVKNKTIFPI